MNRSAMCAPAEKPILVRMRISLTVERGAYSCSASGLSGKVHILCPAVGDGTLGSVWSPKERLDPMLSSLAILERTERVNLMASNNRYVKSAVIGYKETIALRDWLQWK